MTPVNASERTHGQEVSEKVAVSVVYVAAMFMAIMDTTIVNVALPPWAGTSTREPAVSAWCRSPTWSA